MSRHVPLALALVLAAARCGPAEPPPEADPEPPPNELRWEQITAPDDASVLRAPAVVRAPRAQADVAAPIAVQVVRIHADPGTRVEAGAPIVDVTAPSLLEGAAGYASASREARAQTSRAESLEQLRAEGLAQRGQVFERESGARAAAAERDRAGAMLRALGLSPTEARSIRRDGFVTLRAPIAGIVVEVSARIGEIRAPGDGPLARVRGEAAARVEVRTAGAWPTGSALTLEASDGRRVPLALTPLAETIDPDDGTRVAWYATADEVPLPDGLTGTAELAPGDDVFQIPVRALAQRTGRSEVRRRRGEEEATIEVEVLASSGASALVRGELASGDLVALDAPGEAP